jgi:hypothetical protein
VKIDRRIWFVLAFPIAVALIFLGLFIDSKIRPVSVAEWAENNDSVLAKMLALNPGIRGVPTDSDLPFYWVRNVEAGGGKMMIPQNEAQDAKIQLGECDLSKIPAGYLYPHRTETACAEIENSKHFLYALYFRTKDGTNDVVDFYNQLIADPGSRFLLRKSPSGLQEREYREKKTHRLLFSYLLYRQVDLAAFVGYREEPLQNK